MTMFRSRLLRAAGGRRRQPWYVGSNGATDGTQTFQIDALSGGYWSAAAHGDVVVVASACYTDGAKPTISTAGYTTIADLSQGYVRLIVAYKAMGATPDTQVTVANTDRETTRAWVFRGVNVSTPIDATTTTATYSSGAPDGPSITTVTGSAIVLTICAALAQGAVPIAPTNPARMVALGSSSSDWSVGALDNRKLHVDASYIAQGVAGSYNPAEWTPNSSIGESCTATVALRPA